MTRAFSILTCLLAGSHFVAEGRVIRHRKNALETAQLDQNRQAIVADQQRLRENMKALREYVFG